MRALLAVALALAAGLYVAYQQHAVIHDYKEYINAGCHGRYQGRELHAIRDQESIEVQQVNDTQATVQCEDEREPVLVLEQNHTRAILTCEEN